MDPSFAYPAYEQGLKTLDQAFKSQEFKSFAYSAPVNYTRGMIGYWGKTVLDQGSFILDAATKNGKILLGKNSKKIEPSNWDMNKEIWENIESKATCPAPKNWDMTKEIWENIESKATCPAPTTPKKGIVETAHSFATQTLNKAANGLSSAAGYVQKTVIAPAKEFAVNNPMTVGHVGSAVGGAAMIGSAVKAIVNIKNGQSVKKQLSNLAVVVAGAALTGASQLGASTPVQRVALAVTSLAAGVVTGVTLGIVASHKASAVKN